MPATAPPTASLAPLPAPAFTISAEIVVLGGNAVPAAADLDGDGDIDVALPGEGVSILLNDGNGNFADPVHMDVGAEILVATDFTGDGKVDLALAADDNLAVYIGMGDGNFLQPPDLYPTASDLNPATGNANGIDAGDLDGDGDRDITIAYYGAIGAPLSAPGHLAVFINDGAAGFEPAVYYDCASCVDVVMGDFDEDGATDAVTARVNYGAAFWHGNGDGTLTTGTRFATGGRSAAIVADDLNGDGHLDLFIGNDHDFTVSVMLGAGDGTFGEPVVMAAGNTHYIAISDIDGDGDQDVLSGNDTFLHAWLGDGSGSFAVTEGIHLNDPDVRGAAVADFNADGRADLAVSSGESTLVILFGGD
ncbi:MAG: hypothetical protein QOJ81_920 [Chloroflexota bacterium]|nr:hypothetical protein [Chloroflexota bacterium]